MRAGLRAPLDYDVLHFHDHTLFDWEDLTGGSRFPLMDLKVAKALGRRVVFTLSDAAALDALGPAVGQADAILYRDPALGARLPRGRFLPGCDVEIMLIDAPPLKATGPVRIVCAAAGDDPVWAALESLRDAFDFVTVPTANLVSGEVDLVIDQTRPGWYGRTAVSAMAMGRAVLSPVDEAGFAFVPRAMIEQLPVRNLRPAVAAADIAAALQQRADWPAASQAARDYVRRWHDPARIAANMASVYKGRGKPQDMNAETAASSIGDQ